MSAEAFFDSRRVAAASYRRHRAEQRSSRYAGITLSALGALWVGGAEAAQTVQYSYDTQGRLSAVTNSDSTTRTYLYENASLPSALTGVIDESTNRYSTWGYDAQGRATSSSEAGGANATALVYNSDGSVTATDALGAVRTFTFGRYGDRNLVTGISGSQCPTCLDGLSTTYDGAGYPSSRTDYNGNVTQYTFDDTRGLELSRTEAYGTRQARTITTQWDANWREPDMITEPTRKTTFTYDSSGNALTTTVTDTSVTPNVSRTWTYTYDSYGRVLTAKGPRSDVNSTTTYTYYTCTTGGACGQLQSVTDPVGNVTTYNTYDAAGMPLTITDPNGVVTTLTYDARERLTSRVTAGETTGFAYYPTGLLQQITLPDASVIQYSYDAAHRLTQIADGAGNSIQYTLDAAGNRTAERSYDASNTLARALSRVYNSLSELSKSVGAAGTAAVTTAYTYDSNGNPTSIAAPLSRTTGQSFDALNRLTQIVDPNQGTAGWVYNADDQVTSVTDPRGLSTSYTYNGFGDLTGTVSPDTGTSSQTYDSGGNLASRADARGATANFSHDAANRVTQIAYGDQTLAFGYDAGTHGKGRLTSASDANHSMSWQYDALGRVTQKNQTVGSVALSVGYGYTNGNLTSLTTPSGQSVTYTYSNHQVTAISVNGTTLLSGAAYDPFGPARGWTWGNGTQEIRLYDTDGNPNQISGLESTSYTVDSAFRITGISNTTNSSLSWGYGYDSLDRLTSANSSASALTWAYDADGNRLNQGGAGGLPLAASLSYNHRGRLASATVSGSVTNYVYNALGQRIEKSGSIGAVLFAYDEAGHLLGEYSSTGSLIEETVWLGDTPVATLRPNGSSISIYYVHADHLNTPRMVSRPSDNAILWRWDSDPFGTAAPNQNPSGLGAFVYNLRFPGQYYDSETGLDYNGARDYNPPGGRYVESDPTGLDGGSFSTYAYVGGDPIWGVDPTGLSNLVYNNITHTITIYDNSGQQVGSYPANNNTTNPARDPNSAGPYPAGTYPYDGSVNHGTDPNGPYGANGAYRFPRPDCPNCEVHSGRANSGGPQHPTQGCVRTTDDATSKIKNLIKAGDPPVSLTVIK